jgi:rifampicin phosphotransferase
MATVETDRWVVGFDEVDRTQIATVGGKGASLGELSHIAGIRVPDGFCVTSLAFARIMAEAPGIDALLDRLAGLDRSAQRRTGAGRWPVFESEHGESISSISLAIREALESVAVPDDVAAAITADVGRLGPEMAYAVRSSATAEDLPATSFAGQHDSYLNVIGAAGVLDHISRCWGSLFNERAVAYRFRNGIDHRHVRMAVVVQRMVFPDVSGVLFTADPVTSNRKVVSVEATVGRGEGLMSGRVGADIYKVRDGKVVDRVIAPAWATAPPASGPPEPVLTDARAVELARLGRQIESHLGVPQDIEWCLADSDFHIVQSRPITTLFPVPERDDAENHIYVSVGHGQMMTDPMKPLGLSMWKLTAMPPMYVAGGRLFVDVTERLAEGSSRAALLAAFGRGDPLIADALQTVLARPDFLPKVPDGGAVAPPPGGPPASIETDPAIVTRLIARAEESIAACRREIQAKSEVALVEFILDDVAEMKRVLFDPLSQQAIMAGMEATWWLNDHLHEWLGETNAADMLTRSAPGNVTSQMGLDLLDVADRIRPWREVVAFLQDVDDDHFLENEALMKLEGGAEARNAICGYLEMYGMRGLGEIDVTRPRWSEQPTALVPVILGHIQNFEPGEARRRFDKGNREAQATEVDLLERLRGLPDGNHKADETKRMIDRVRTYIGYREFPKYGMIRRYFIYKRALLAEAERLVEAQILREPDDIFFLSLGELLDVVRSGHVQAELIDRRKHDFASYGALTPPRVFTSDGEAVAGSYGRTGLPADALVGLAVSAGTVEGRARVILDMADAAVEEGDILVTAHTDPGWSPLFVAVKGLVTEVGGLMTHGAVIAREYGLAAVVGVENATHLIEDGQRIRVNGSDGYVQILEEA